MIERSAPLYVETHDLARWLLEHLEAWPDGRGADLRRPLADAACDLVTHVAVALTFPDRRAERLRRADETVVRTRVLLRLACELALLSPKSLRFAQGHLREIGRMLGGWQRQLRREAVPGQDFKLQGTGSPRRPRDPRWQLLEFRSERSLGLSRLLEPVEPGPVPGLPRLAAFRPE